MAFDSALNQPLSLESIYYPSTAWQQRKKTIEGQHGAANDVALRLNAVIQALQILGKQR
jgi:hypothetical protein